MGDQRQLNGGKQGSGSGLDADHLDADDTPLSPYSIDVANIDILNFDGSSMGSGEFLKYDGNNLISATINSVTPDNRTVRKNSNGDIETTDATLSKDFSNYTTISFNRVNDSNYVVLDVNLASNEYLVIHDLSIFAEGDNNIIRDMTVDGNTHPLANASSWQAATSSGEDFSGLQFSNVVAEDSIYLKITSYSAEAGGYVIYEVKTT